MFFIILLHFGSRQKPYPPADGGAEICLDPTMLFVVELEGFMHKQSMNQSVNNRARSALTCDLCFSPGWVSPRSLLCGGNDLMIASLNAASRIRGSISSLTHWRLKLALSLHFNSRNMPLQIVCKMSGKLWWETPRVCRLALVHIQSSGLPHFLNYGPKNLMI